MRRLYVLLTAVSAVILSSLHACAAGWDAEADIARLRSEVPSIGAFSGADAVIWHLGTLWTLGADGTRQKTERTIMLIAEDAPDDVLTIDHDCPTGTDVRVEVEYAAYHDASTGRKISDISCEEIEAKGAKSLKFKLPAQARGQVAAIQIKTAEPMQYYLDDVVKLSGKYPIWEETIDLRVPSGMEVFWEGAGGVRAPQIDPLKNGTDRVVWSMHNVPADRDVSIVQQEPPMLIFSLQRGMAPLLKNMANTETLFHAPAMPHEVARVDGADLMKVGLAIQAYMRERRTEACRSAERQIRDQLALSQAEGWTEWEEALITAHWLRTLGYDVRVFWSQAMPVGISGPSSSDLWERPVLVIAPPKNGEQIFYAAAQKSDFGRVDPIIYGRPIYRFGDGDIERLNVPRGSASEHMIQQSWKIAMSESGDAEGKLELSINGAWLDMLGIRDMSDTEEAMAIIRERFAFSLPGIDYSVTSIKRTPTGIRITIELTSHMGIVSGSEILMKIPTIMPDTFIGIPDDGSKFTLKFPFIFEYEGVISTPAGYKVVMLPAKIKTGDSKASLDITTDHWPKRRQAVISLKWAVRDPQVADTLSSRVADSFRQLVRWSRSSIPLRK